MNSKEEVIKHYAQFGVQVDVDRDNPETLIGYDDCCIITEEFGYRIIASGTVILRKINTLTKKECLEVFGDNERGNSIAKPIHKMDYEHLLKMKPHQSELFTLWKLHIDTFDAIEKGLAIGKDE